MTCYRENFAVLGRLNDYYFENGDYFQWNSLRIMLCNVWALCLTKTVAPKKHTVYMTRKYYRCRLPGITPL